MAIQLLDPVIAWIRERLPDREIAILWPDIMAPEWVIFLLAYSKVWIPVLLGLAVGAIALRRHRKSQKLKRRWKTARAVVDQDAGTGEQGGEGVGTR